MSISWLKKFGTVIVKHAPVTLSIASKLGLPYASLISSIIQIAASWGGGEHAIRRLRYAHTQAGAEFAAALRAGGCGECSITYAYGGRRVSLYTEYSSRNSISLSTRN